MTTIDPLGVDFTTTRPQEAMDKDDIVFSCKQLLAQYISGEAVAIAVTIVTNRGMHGVFGASTVTDRLALLGALELTGGDVAASLAPEEVPTPRLFG